MNDDNLSASDFPHLSESRVLIVGLVRDAAQKIATDVLRLKSAFASVKELHWCLIESDSFDANLRVLEELSEKTENFSFRSLGKLRDQMPLRTPRLSRCRNAYLLEIRQNPLYRNIDYVVVSDLDGVNDCLTREAVESCWLRSDWDMVSANQDGPYFDVWALRHELWSPNDCWAQNHFLNRFEPNFEKNLNVSVYSRMIRVPRENPWIEVESAFGGLAIYRRRLLEYGEYVGLNALGEEVCEHVPFHAALRQKGARLFINPSMITASYTERTEVLRFPSSWVRKAKDLFKYRLRQLKSILRVN
jgi:hypothetical protein